MATVIVKFSHGPMSLRSNRPNFQNNILCTKDVGGGQILSNCSLLTDEPYRHFILKTNLFSIICFIREERYSFLKACDF